MTTRADATINAKATGAMSYAFITALKQDPKQSYVELLNSIRDVLEKEYSQKPQLSCSHPLGMFFHLVAYGIQRHQLTISRYRASFRHVKGRIYHPMNTLKRDKIQFAFLFYAT